MNIPSIGAGNTTTAHPGIDRQAAVTASLPQSTAATPGSPDKPAVNPSELKRSIEQINKFLKNNSEVQFSIDEASGFSVVKVIDTETKKVLRQFPSEQALEIGKSLQDFKGLLINSKA